MNETKPRNITTITLVLLFVAVGALATYEYMQLQSVMNQARRDGFQEEKAGLKVIVYNARLLVRNRIRDGVKVWDQALLYDMSK